MPEQYSIKIRRRKAQWIASIVEWWRFCCCFLSSTQCPRIASTRTRSAQRVLNEVGCSTCKEDPFPNIIRNRQFVPEIFAGEFTYGLVLEQGRLQAPMLHVFICRGVLIFFFFFCRFDFVDKWQILVVNIKIATSFLWMKILLWNVWREKQGYKSAKPLFTAFRSRLMGFMAHNHCSVHPHQPHLISFRNHCIALIVATFFGRNNHSIVFSTRARH